jgi:CheY-like chemotaxis protein
MLVRVAVAAAGEGKVEVRRVRVLVADDHGENRRVVGLRLDLAGAEVGLASDGLVALEMARAARDAGRPFDLVLMDMQMPVLDGFEATRRLRDEGFRTPVVALTAHAMPEDRQDCLRFGCDGHISKPIDWPFLIAEVNRLLAVAGVTRASEDLCH